MGFTVDNTPFLCAHKEKFLLPSSKLVGLLKKLPKSNALKAQKEFFDSNSWGDI